MIKLFGWEGKMNKKIQERREEELNWMWKDKVHHSDPFLVVRLTVCPC